MTHDDLKREARKVLEPLRYSPIGISSSRRVEAGRHDLLPHLARIIEAVPKERSERQLRQRRWQRARWVLGGSLGLAAAVAMWLGITRVPPLASTHTESAHL